MPPAFFLMCLLSPMPFPWRRPLSLLLAFGCRRWGLSAWPSTQRPSPEEGAGVDSIGGKPSQPVKHKTSPNTKRITTAQLAKQLSSVAALLPQLSQQLTRASSLLFRLLFEEAGVARRASSEGAPRTLSRAVSYAALGQTGEACRHLREFGGFAG